MNKTKVLQFVVKYKLLEVSRRLMEWLGDFVLKKKNVKGSRVLSMKYVSLKLFTQRPRPSMIFSEKYVQHTLIQRNKMIVLVQS